jgi:hypothetical protein
MRKQHITLGDNFPRMVILPFSAGASSSYPANLSYLLDTSAVFFHERASFAALIRTIAMPVMTFFFSSGPIVPVFLNKRHRAFAVRTVLQ